MCVAVGVLEIVTSWVASRSVHPTRAATFVSELLAVGGLLPTTRPGPEQETTPVRGSPEQTPTDANIRESFMPCASLAVRPSPPLRTGDANQLNHAGEGVRHHVSNEIALPQI